jgi:polygalacturonase
MSLIDLITRHGYVNVKDFGAKGDGQHDDYCGILRALVALKCLPNNPFGGGIVFFPPGHYLQLIA